MGQVICCKISCTVQNVVLRRLPPSVRSMVGEENSQTILRICIQHYQVWLLYKLGGIGDLVWACYPCKGTQGSLGQCIQSQGALLELEEVVNTAPSIRLSVYRSSSRVHFYPLIAL